MRKGMILVWKGGCLTILYIRSLKKFDIRISFIKQLYFLALKVQTVPGVCWAHGFLQEFFNFRSAVHCAHSHTQTISFCTPSSLCRYLVVWGKFIKLESCVDRPHESLSVSCMLDFVTSCQAGLKSSSHVCICWELFLNGAQITAHTLNDSWVSSLWMWLAKSTNKSVSYIFREFLHAWQEVLRVSSSSVYINGGVNSYLELQFVCFGSAVALLQIQVETLGGWAADNAASVPDWRAAPEDVMQHSDLYTVTHEQNIHTLTDHMSQSQNQHSIFKAHQVILDYKIYKYIHRCN